MTSESSRPPTSSSVTAEYSSPSGEQYFSHSLPPIPEPKSSNYVEDKTAYLNQLRASTKRLQDDVNAFLTAKMEEDKATAPVQDSGQAESKPNKKKARDEEEEENYGEEVEDDNE